MSEGRVTLHVVQPFIEVDGIFVAEEPIACQSATEARAKARQLKATKAGVIAWSRTSPDAALGEWGDPTVLARYGAIPDEYEKGGGAE